MVRAVCGPVVAKHCEKSVCYWGSRPLAGCVTWGSQHVAFLSFPARGVAVIIAPVSWSCRAVSRRSDTQSPCTLLALKK